MKERTDRIESRRLSRLWIPEFIKSRANDRIPMVFQRDDAMRTSHAMVNGFDWENRCFRKLGFEIFSLISITAVMAGDSSMRQ